MTDTIRTKLMPYNGISTGNFTQLVIKKYMQGQQLDAKAKEIRTQLQAANQELLDLLFSLAAKIREVEESSATVHEGFKMVAGLMFVAAGNE